MIILSLKVYFTVCLSIIGVLGGLASSETNEITCLQRESQALLEFKAGVIDDDGVLSSWENGTDCCKWKGVQCDNRVHQVVALDLSEFSLRGGKMISSSLLELDELYHLDLSYNDFNESQIPEFIGSLVKLEYLNLSECSLSGMIPYSLQNLSLLQVLDLSNNDIHSDLGLLSRLQSLKYVDLSFTNPPEAYTWGQVVDKFPKEKEIHLQGCSHSPSASPTSSLNRRALNISSSLSYIDLSGNNIGNWTILDPLKSFSCLSHLKLWANNIEGNIPDFLWNFTHLSYIDLSDNFLIDGSISKAIGNLMSLYYLDLSGNKLEGSIPEALGNLVSLYHLDLYDNHLEGSIPEALGNLRSLSHLNLGGNNLQGSIPDSLWNFTHLSYLDLSDNLLIDGSIPEVLGNLVSLYHLDLSNNQLEGSIPEALGNFMSLSYLDLSSNQLEGSIPEALGNLTSLSHLDLSNNSLELPDQLSFSSLVYLDFSRNKIQGDLMHLMMQLLNSTLVEVIHLGENELFGSLPNMSVFQGLTELRFNDNYLNESVVEESFRLPSLQTLDLSNNEFIGRIPNLSSCSSLEYLYLNDNMFSGTLTESIGTISNLVELYLSSNDLQGLISEAHFSNLSTLLILDLSFNSNLTIRISSFWNAPFQLEGLLLSHCRLGPRFPGWLKNQTYLTVLDISNASIMDTIPNWFWNRTRVPQALNMSHNQIYGTLPDISSKPNIQLMDMSFNQFSGTLPPLPLSADELHFSNNRFSGTIMNVCNSTPIYILDVSDNQLSGQISSDCLMKLVSLYYLNLGNNYLSGNIHGKGSKCNLVSLHLRNNSFSGYIPKSLSRCRGLVALDFQENKFHGTIPTWLGESMPNLVILSLKANKLNGSLPSSLCHLQKLQVLDISMNFISGAIPNCVNNFTALTSERNSNLGSTGLLNLTDKPNHIGSSFYDTDQLVWKGQNAEFITTLWLLRAIDFSNNNFSGEIPSEITSLVELVSFNLSGNNLTGPIPHNIAQLKLLEILDLSHNSLSGNIPPTLSQMSELGALDLSFNNLSGKIPLDGHMDTFTAASFIGNGGLCGPPLMSKPCPEDVEVPNKPKFVDGTDTIGIGHDKDMFKTREFYISMALGFIVFFWGVFGTLYLSKRWNLAILNMFTTVDDWFYVKIRLTKRRVERYFQNEE